MEQAKKILLDWNHDIFTLFFLIERCSELINFIAVPLQGEVVEFDRVFAFKNE